MIKTMFIGLLVGILGGNAIPHFIKGITKENYPSALGNGPVPNLLGGWILLNISCTLICYWNYQEYPFPSFISCSAGLLLIGLFHAGPGAFGKKQK